MKYLSGLVLVLFSMTVFGANYSVDIKGMTCQMCVKAITGELNKTGKVEKVVVSLEEKKATFSELAGKEITEQEIKAAIKKAGYSATQINKVH